MACAKTLVFSACPYGASPRKWRTHRIRAICSFPTPRSLKRVNGICCCHVWESSPPLSFVCLLSSSALIYCSCVALWPFIVSFRSQLLLFCCRYCVHFSSGCILALVLPGDSEWFPRLNQTNTLALKLMTAPRHSPKHQVLSRGNKGRQREELRNSAAIELINELY